MLDKISDKILEMLKEAGVYSLNRVVPVAITIVMTLAFFIVTAYLIVNGDKPSTWGEYGEFCTVYLTSFGICATWLTGNKITNSKYNTDPGKPGKPLENPTVQKTVDAMDKIADAVNKYEGKLK